MCGNPLAIKKAKSRCRIAAKVRPMPLGAERTAATLVEAEPVGAGGASASVWPSGGEGKVGAGVVAGDVTVTELIARV
jgi:hypothetical protein